MCHNCGNVGMRRASIKIPDVCCANLGSRWCSNPTEWRLRSVRLHAAIESVAITPIDTSAAAAMAGQNKITPANVAQMSEVVFRVVNSKPRSNPQTTPKNPGGSVHMNRSGTCRDTCGVRRARSAAANNARIRARIINRSLRGAIESTAVPKRYKGTESTNPAAIPPTSKPNRKRIPPEAVRRSIGLATPAIDRPQWLRDWRLAPRRPAPISPMPIQSSTPV